MMKFSPISQIMAVLSIVYLFTNLVASDHILRGTGPISMDHNNSDRMHLSILLRSKENSPRLDGVKNPTIFSQTICVENCEDRFKQLCRACYRLQEEDVVSNIMIDSLLADEKRYVVFVSMSASGENIFRVLEQTLSAYKVLIVRCQQDDQ